MSGKLSDQKIVLSKLPDQRNENLEEHKDKTFQKHDLANNRVGTFNYPANMSPNGSVFDGRIVNFMIACS